MAHELLGAKTPYLDKDFQVRPAHIICGAHICSPCEDAEKRGSAARGFNAGPRFSGFRRWVENWTGFLPLRIPLGVQLGPLFFFCEATGGQWRRMFFRQWIHGRRYFPTSLNCGGKWWFYNISRCPTLVHNRHQLRCFFYVWWVACRLLQESLCLVVQLPYNKL